MTLHREGIPSFIITAFFIAGLVFGVKTYFPNASGLHYFIYFLCTLLAIIILQFFRKPLRTATISANQVIAPADGKVVVIENVTETEYFNGPRTQVSIFMSPINVHINFNPIAGIVSFFKYHPGKKLFAWDPKSSTENERTTVVVKHSSGTEVLYRQIAGALARRIVWYIDKGMTVQQGDEFGFIKFGSRVDIFLPVGTKILVNLNDVTTGGITPIADLI